MAATKQVTRTVKNLLDSIRDGNIQQPFLMDWNPWQKWRTTSGKRRARRLDGSTTSPQQEVDLEREIMEQFYTSNWTATLVVAAATAGKPSGRTGGGSRAVRCARVRRRGRFSSPAPPPPTRTMQHTAELTETSLGSGQTENLGAGMSRSPGSLVGQQKKVRRP